MHMIYRTNNYLKSKQYYHELLKPQQQSLPSLLTHYNCNY